MTRLLLEGIVCLWSHTASTCAALYYLYVIQGGGVRVNNVKVEAEQHILKESDLIDGRLMLIAAGKKNKMLVRISSQSQRL